MNIAIFGCGNYGHRALKYIEEQGVKVGDRIVGFFDNNELLWGNTIGRYLVHKPEDIIAMDIDAVVITPVMYKSDIKHQLLEMGIPEEKCLFTADYESRVLIKNEYLRRYKANEYYHKKNILKTDRIIVYTGIFGAYDDLKDPDYVGEGVDYVCFTNQQDITSDIWDVRHVEDDGTDNIMIGKIYKFFPDKLFPEYDVSVWVDGKVHIKNDLRTYIEKYGGEAPMLCFPHYSRKCIYNETFACMTIHPSIKMQLMKQITDYYLDSYPAENGLYEMSCIVRKHNDERVKQLMDAWMKEIETYSKRDQISFPYVCYKNDFLPDISNIDVRFNYWFERCQHKTQNV